MGFGAEYLKVVQKTEQSPADSFPIGGRIVLVPTALALSKTLLYVHGLNIRRMRRQRQRQRQKTLL